MDLPDVLAVYVWKGEIKVNAQKGPALQRPAFFEFTPK